MREEIVATVKRVDRDLGCRENKNFSVNHGLDKIKMILDQLRMFSRFNRQIFWAKQFLANRM